MKKFFNLLLAIVVGILAASIVSSLISLSLWLDMRVHSRYIYYVFIALAVITSLFMNRANEKVFLIIEFISIALILCLGKFRRIMYELREAMRINMNINLFQNIIIIILIVINLMVFLKFIIKKKKSA
ncbi:hypothetical protein [Fenollaria sporofastidiosus]|uniref:hypothetical protein n=1 Tax=Fenollaria sporofastidiosus TaxID=2811778 RepID=UPI001C0087F1|nr:hypothetical protein [Fenollaria sporofastidiosus]